MGRVDFLLERERIIIEFDGLMKYANANGREALAAEKSREDRLRALGYEFVRLTRGRSFPASNGRTSDAANPRPTSARRAS